MLAVISPAVKSLALIVATMSPAGVTVVVSVVASVVVVVVASVVVVAFVVVSVVVSVVVVTVVFVVAYAEICSRVPVTVIVPMFTEELRPPFVDLSLESTFTPLIV